MSGKPPNCEECGYVTIIPGNFEVMHLIENYLGLMIDGMGSINSFGISKVFEWEEIDITKQQTILFKIMLYINIALKAQSEKTTFSKSKTKATRKVSKKGGREIVTYKG